MNIRKVHVVFKTHLDIGFTDLAANVRERYLQHFIPQAIRTAREVNSGGGPPRFVWTTGSWLIREYLASQPEAAVRDMEAAIGEGHIAWHALPFTTHTELMDERLFRYGLTYSRELDCRFGKTTLAAKMTDVPGHTLGIVAPLVENGVRYLHIGVNTASAVADVPEFFLWKDHGGNELIVNYASEYGAIHMLDGHDEALAFAFTGDNLGPCTPKDIHQSLAQFRIRFPGAEVFASTLDAFAVSLLRVKNLLPVITSEIGDTWIHGVGTDPYKVSRFRQLLRLREHWISEGCMKMTDREYRSFSDFLLMIPEHTWGMDLKTHLPDFTHYSKRDLCDAMRTDVVRMEDIPPEYAFIRPMAEHGLHGFEVHTYSAYVKSWEEQRGYLWKAVETLEEDRKREAIAAMNDMMPVLEKSYAIPVVPGFRQDIGGFGVTFGGDGAISRLEDAEGNLLSEGLGQFVYHNYGTEDYRYWFVHYIRNMEICHDWAISDFGKLGMDRDLTAVENKQYGPRLQELSMDGERLRVRALLVMPEEAAEKFGAPRVIQIDYRFEADRILMDLQWFRKDANRMPEAMWLVFCLANGAEGPILTKLGSPVSPQDVVSRGNRNLHACEAIAYEAGPASVRLVSLDAPLISTKGMDILRFDDVLPEPDGDIAVNLYNNLWGTNFPMWSGEDAKFRFEISFGAASRNPAKCRKSRED